MILFKSPSNQNNVVEKFTTFNPKKVTSLPHALLSSEHNGYFESHVLYFVHLHLVKSLHWTNLVSSALGFLGDCPLVFYMHISSVKNLDSQQMK